MTTDPYELSRFLEAQEPVYAQALAELRAGRKQSHWMWFIFPQIEGLGTSAMAVRYAIADRGEAEAYLNHPVLGARLRECVEAMLAHADTPARDILGPVDGLKFRSSVTLFAQVAEEGSIFQRSTHSTVGIPTRLRWNCFAIPEPLSLILKQGFEKRPKVLASD